LNERSKSRILNVQHVKAGQKTEYDQVNPKEMKSELNESEPKRTSDYCRLIERAKLSGES
jgi:hypothetical protein